MAVIETIAEGIDKVTGLANKEEFHVRNEIGNKQFSISTYADGSIDLFDVITGANMRIDADAVERLKFVLQNR